jgi:hypothetical protein
MGQEFISILDKPRVFVIGLERSGTQGKRMKLVSHYAPSDTVLN